MAKKNTINADEIYKALTEEDGEVIYSLSDKTITGKLDLIYHSINKAVYIQNCEFLDDVYLSYCEFKQPVYFSGTHFEQSFICVRTVFSGILNCCDANFRSNVSFQDVKCVGNAHFQDSQFRSKEKLADFLNAIFEGNLECVLHGKSAVAQLIPRSRGGAPLG